MWYWTYAKFILWSVIHKAVAVSEWLGKISKVAFTAARSRWNWLNTSSLVVHLLNMVAAHCYIIWQLFAKRENLGPRKLCSMMQCLFDQPLCKALKRFSHIWFYLRSGLPWIIWRQRNDVVFNVVQWPIEKMHQVIWGLARLQHHIRYFGRFPVSQFNDCLGGVDLKCTQWVQFRSTYST